MFAYEWWISAGIESLDFFLSSNNPALFVKKEFDFTNLRNNLLRPEVKTFFQLLWLPP
jgi:hypothetical protein